MQSNGAIIVAHEFNRVIGKAGEKIVAVIIDSRTGRIITAFPAISFSAIGLAAHGWQDPPQMLYGGSFEEHVSAAVDEINTSIMKWELNAKNKPTDYISTILDFIVGIETAGDPKESLYIEIRSIILKHGGALIKELEDASQQSFSQARRNEIEDQFRLALAGAGDYEFD